MAAAKSDKPADSGPALTPRKVLHVDTSTAWREPQEQLLHLVKGMEARKWPVSLACPVISPLWEAVAFLGERRITIPADLSERTTAAIFRAQPDVVAAHTLSGFAAASTLPLPIVVHRTVPDLPPGPWMERRPDGFIASSETVARALRRVGIRNVHVVREGASPLPSASPAPDGPAVLVAATPPGHPDNEMITAAAGLLAGADFGVLGQGPAHYRGVRWLGERDDVANLYESATCFLQLSLPEGLATQSIRAMLAGVPLIVGASNGLPDVVGDTAFIIEEGKIGKLVEAIQTVLTGGHTPVDRAADRAAKTFGVEAMVDNTIAVYDAVVKASASRWGASQG